MINLTTPILDEDLKEAVTNVNKKDEDGNYLRDEGGKMIKEELRATLYGLCRTAILSSNGDADPVSLEKRHDLFRKIQNQNEVELTKEEAELLTTMICEKFDVLFSGQAIKMLRI